MNVQPLCERVALIQVDEEYQGKIVLPPQRNLHYTLGECVAVGDGKYPDGSSKPMYCKPGEIYLFQIDHAHRVNSTFVIDGKSVLLLHQNDMMAKLSSPTINEETLDAQGPWVILKTYVKPRETIIIPDTAETPELLHFELFKKGNGVKLDVNIGDEIFAARGRITSFSLDGTIYGFIPENFIFGHAVKILPTQSVVVTDPYEEIQSGSSEDLGQH